MAPATLRQPALPPIADVPLIVPCPCCRRVLRTSVSFLQPQPSSRVRCPWCHRRVVVRAPAARR